MLNSRGEITDPCWVPLTAGVSKVGDCMGPVATWLAVSQERLDEVKDSVAAFGMVEVFDNGLVCYVIKGALNI